MSNEIVGYSPNIFIRLRVGDTVIRLADVMHTTATLFESASLPPNSKGLLTIDVGGNESVYKVFLKDGINPGDNEVSLAYVAE